MMNKPEMSSCSPVLTTSLPNSGSESDRDLIKERKRKRLESNRESARRSRMKKQKHVDDLNAQLMQLGEENRQTATEIAVTKEHYVKIEAENSIMRAQLTELNHRLSSLNEFLRLAAGQSSSASGGFGIETGHSAAGGFGMNTGPSAAAGGFGIETGHSAAGGFGMKTGPSAAAAGGFGMKTGPSAAAGGFGMETGHSAAGGFGMETDPSAAGGFGMETGYSATGGFSMETGDGGGGVTDYGGGGGGDGFYDGMMNPLNQGFYNQTPNMTSASTGVGDVLNCW